MAALSSAFLTTGPEVGHFEAAVRDFTGAKYSVAVCNGTAALHCAMFAVDIKPGVLVNRDMCTKLLQCKVMK